MNGRKKELQIVGIGDTSFKRDEKVVWSIILLLVNRDFTKASPIHWQTKQIERVCHSSKDAETLILNKLVEDAIFAARQIETLIFGRYDIRIPIHLFTDSEATLESFISTKQIEKSPYK